MEDVKSDGFKSKLKIPESFNRVSPSTAPLKFRSFDEFYKYYSKKQSNPLYNRFKLPSNECKYKVTVLDKTDSDVRDNLSQSMSNLIIHTSDSYKGNINQPIKHGQLINDKVVLNSIQGSVKKICQIFQKAHDDSNYRTKLKETILKNKRIKTPEQHSKTDSDVNTCDSLKIPNNIYMKRDPSPRSIGPLLSDKDVETLKLISPQNTLDDPIIKISHKPKTEKHESPSPKAPSPLTHPLFKLDQQKKHDLLTLPTGSTSHLTGVHSGGEVVENFDVISDGVFNVQSPETTLVEGNEREAILQESEQAASGGQCNPGKDVDHTYGVIISPPPPKQSSHLIPDVESSELVDEMLDRFLNDASFCDNFSHLVDNIESYSENDLNQFDKILNDLQIIVDDDLNIDDDPNSFKWYFTTPKIFEVDLTDRTEISEVAPEEVDLVPEDLRTNDADKFKWLTGV